jgi:hypothetical protein
LRLDGEQESVPTGEEINKPSEQESNAGGLGGLIGGKPVKTTAQVGASRITTFGLLTCPKQYQVMTAKCVHKVKSNTPHLNLYGM